MGKTEMYYLQTHLNLRHLFFNSTYYVPDWLQRVPGYKEIQSVPAQVYLV